MKDTFIPLDIILLIKKILQLEKVYRIQKLNIIKSKSAAVLEIPRDAAKLKIKKKKQLIGFQQFF